jgi:hypothetical protein
VIPCTKRFVHDWTVCPFAHAGEKAVRRDPRTHEYTGIACPDMKKTGHCLRGDKCPYAHNVFEYWLHPTRYRTQLCNDGPSCARSICFFAHTLEELRVPAHKPFVSPEALARASLEAIHQNPHPLSAVNSKPTAPTPIASTGMAQHGNLSFHTHTSPVMPRLSADYGSVPRWSNNSSICGSVGDTTFNRRSFGDVGRRSFGDLGIGHSTSLLGNTKNQNAALQAPMADEEMAGRLSLDISPPCSSRGSTPPADLLATKEKSSKEASKAVSLDGFSAEDDSLAQSLASLKIALTQQNSQSTSASNHEVVISTLHQILRNAAAQHGGGQNMDSQSCSRAPSTEAAAVHAVLEGLKSSLYGSQSGPGSLTVSDVSGVETPSRSSLEDISHSASSEMNLNFPQVSDAQVGAFQK